MACRLHNSKGQISRPVSVQLVLISVREQYYRSQCIQSTCYSYIKTTDQLLLRCLAIANYLIVDPQALELVSRPVPFPRVYIVLY